MKSLGVNDPCPRFIGPRAAWTLHLVDGPRSTTSNQLPRRSLMSKESLSLRGYLYCTIAVCLAVGSCGRDGNKPPRVRDVTFSSPGSDFHTVSKDDDTGDYGTPHWKDDPAGGAVEQQFPVCFKKNTTMQVNVTIQIGKASDFPTPKIKGDGSDNIDVPPSTANLDGNTLTIENVSLNTALPDQVKRYGAFKIDWQVSPDGGTKWLNAGSSTNEIFVTRDTPTCAKRFHTVLYLATENGGTTEEATCVTNTWLSFSTGTGPQNVCAWNVTSGTYNRKLHYYKDLSSVLENNLFTTKKLLEYRDGDCWAWASFFRDCLLANGITSSRTQIISPDGYQQFAVKDIDFVDPPSWPERDDPWKYHGDGLTEGPVTIRGQNTAPPGKKKFQGHQLVKVGDDRYDPSYGVKVTSEQGFTDSSVDAWEAWVDNHWRWRKVDTAPPTKVRFQESVGDQFGAAEEARERNPALGSSARPEYGASCLHGTEVRGRGGPENRTLVQLRGWECEAPSAVLGHAAARYARPCVA